jgi:organic radical activating enzyme
MSDIYCTAPFNGITVRENGDVKTCCVGSEIIGNLNHDSIQNILASTKIKAIQASMLHGSSDLKNCQACLQQEQDSGLASIRQHYLKFYPDVQIELKLRSLDIRWNNLCNLGCVYCSPTFSSVWEDRQTIRINKPVKEYQDDLLQFILDNADQVNEIMLVGGEPLLMKQNYKLFEKLPSKIKISLVTNFSYDLERLPCFESLVNRPRDNIKWNLSLENSQQKFEYVRNGASWSQVEKNFSVLNQYWPDSACVNMVYSVFTAFDIEPAVQTFHNFNIKKFNFQSYFGHPAFDVFAMPLPMQKIALDQLLSALDIHASNIHPEDRDLYPIENASRIIQHLQSQQQPNSNLTKQQFNERIKWTNQWNKNQFQDLWPEVINLVDQYLL